MRLGDVWPVVDKRKAFETLQTSLPTERMKQGNGRSGQNHHELFRITSSQGEPYFVKTLKCFKNSDIGNIRKARDHYIQNTLAWLIRHGKLKVDEDSLNIQFPKTIGMVKSLKPAEIDKLTTLYQVLVSTKKLLQKKSLTAQETQQLVKRYGEATPKAVIAHYTERYPKLFSDTDKDGILVKLDAFKKQLHHQFSQQYLLTHTLNPNDNNKSYIGFVMEYVGTNCQKIIQTSEQSALGKLEQLKTRVQQTLGIGLWDLDDDNLRNTILNPKGLFIIDPSFDAEKNWFQKAKELLASK